MVAQQNRIHTNGHHRSANEPSPSVSASGLTPKIHSRDVEKLMRKYPGPALIAGLVTGGIIGWLTLKLGR